METVKEKVAVVTGASRGLGRAIASGLAAAGARVWAVARDEARLAALARDVKGVVNTISADVADEATARTVLERACPDILILNAGATPRTAPLLEHTWESFTAPWDCDVKQAFHFGQESLRRPLAPGSVVIILSSGAAVGGSPLSGGYAGAKRMQWFLADYLQKASDELGRGIRFHALLPRQIIGETDLGHSASSGYARALGITKEKFLERFGTPLTPAMVGQGVVDIVTKPEFQATRILGITGRGLEPVG
jgi:NAD(P)-dependent dehydrogenase (short-subunit alcohol dehydrogenase family)